MTCAVLLGFSAPSSLLSEVVDSISQLFGADLVGDIFVNSYTPVRGQTRYRVGFAYRGLGSVKILASDDAARGRMKTRCGFGDGGGSEYFALVSSEEDAVFTAVSFVDLVFGIVDMTKS
jgi:hypothetical protein